MTQIYHTGMSTMRILSRDKATIERCRKVLHADTAARIGADLAAPIASMTDAGVVQCVLSLWLGIKAAEGANTFQGE